MIAKKKQILTATLMIALAASVAVNWYYTNPKTAADGETRQTQLSAGDSLLVAASVSSQQESETEPESESEQGGDANSAEEYFSSARLKKQQAHDELCEKLEELIEQAQGENADKITAYLSALETAYKVETDCENLIRAKLGSECVVVLSGENAQVVVAPGAVSEAAVLQITEIVDKNADVSAENLTIIEAK